PPVDRIWPGVDRAGASGAPAAGRRRRPLHDSGGAGPTGGRPDASASGDARPLAAGTGAPQARCRHELAVYVPENRAGDDEYDGATLIGEPATDALRLYATRTLPECVPDLLVIGPVVRCC